MPHLDSNFLGTDLRRYLTQDADHCGKDPSCFCDFPIRNSGKSPELFRIVLEHVNLEVSH